MRREFTGIKFRDAGKAERNLGRLEKLLAPTLVEPLASLLEPSPDPDGALNQLERYAEKAPAEVLANLSRFPAALSYLVAIFGHSEALAEILLADPGLVVQFARDRKFTRLKSKEDLLQDFARFSTTQPDPWLSAQLARFKRRNFLRIMLKDVLGLATLGETTLELSALADVTLENALIFCRQELEKRYGHPQFRDAKGRIARSTFSVISLGKLGGNELNYSSDIDLLYLYSRDGETSGGSERDSVITNKEFFVRLAHAITRTITQITPQGEVFRVDLRLRPEGEQGDLAISLNSSAEYYERRARDWELQMLIKARHSAGDIRLTRDFLRRVEPYIYASPGDFEAVESVLRAREKISRKLRESKSDAVDVKLHPGGIRDIEFLTQCLQRLYGGRDLWVRSGGTLFALRKLNDKGRLSDADFAALTSAYGFFRKLEHRIQLEMTQQTHRLPAGHEPLDRLARRTGIAAERRPGAALQAEVKKRFARVEEIYRRLLRPPAAKGEAAAPFRLEPLAGLSELRAQTFASVVQMLEAHAPELAQALGQAHFPGRATKNVTKFLAALLGSPERFRAARADPEGVRRAAEVVGWSEPLGELLIRHPEEIARLGGAQAERKAAGAAQMVLDQEPPALADAFPWVAEGAVPYREKMSLLRREYRGQTLALGARDLEGLGSVYAALGRWSHLAGRAIESARSIAAQSLGHPPDAEALPFVVLALGRLGLNEFDMGSDADLVFLVSDDVPPEEVPNWTRLAAKTIEVLSSYTRDGTVLVVDTRLRPRGQEGELVAREEALVSYLSEAAQVWEGLTYLKAFPIAGHPRLAQQAAERLRAACAARFPRHEDLEGELHRMRRRLEREVLVPPSNTKTAPGGYYDADYALAYLRLRHGVRCAPGANSAEQAAVLEAAGALSAEDARALREGAAFLRSVDHALRLVTGKPTVGLPEHVGHAEALELLLRRWGTVSEKETVARRLRDVQQQVRYAYRRLVEAE